MWAFPIYKYCQYYWFEKKEEVKSERYGGFSFPPSCQVVRMWAGWLAPLRPDGQHRLWLMEPTHSAACDAINPKRTTDKYNHLNLMLADAVNFWRWKNHQNEQMHILWTSCGSSWLLVWFWSHLNIWICILMQFVELCLKKVFAGQCLTAIDVFYTKASDRYLVFAASWLPVISRSAHSARFF